MKASLSTLKVIVILGTALLSTSCGSMQSVKTSTTASMGKVGEGFGKFGSGVGESFGKVGTNIGDGFGKVGTGIGDGFGKVADVTMSPFRPGVPVVEARQGDLKEIQSGQDQALAFQRKQNQNNFWSFLGPVNFKEPALPSDGGAMDGGLLPPLE